MPTPAATAYADFHRRSLTDRDAFWAEQATLIDWEHPFDSVCDASRAPFTRWFVGGRTNLCHNAVDRHLAARAAQNALICVSTETGVERIYSFAELHAEVKRMAACLQALGAGQGDRVLIYMPMIPEAVFAMLACARIGAIHSVVFGGFASGSLASRIDDAEPSPHRQRRRRQPRRQGDRLQAAARRGDPAGRATSRRRCCWSTAASRRWSASPAATRTTRTLRERHLEAQRARAPGSSRRAPSYTLYTSGTTGSPKGVQRDTGGYAVALAASMKHIFCGQPGETYFSTSDIGWVVGHSYIVYGPLIAGMATILYEGLPIRPDAGIWWRLVEKYKVTAMFTAPTAIRVLKKHDPKYLRESRPLVAARAVPGRRAARRADRLVDRRGARQADHRQLLADRERLADPDRRQRHRADTEQVRQPGRADVRLRRQADRRVDRRRTSSSRTARASS